MRITIGLAVLLMPAIALAQTGQLGAPGRYAIIDTPGNGTPTMLIDTATGKTWELKRDPSRNAVLWVPMARQDSTAEMNVWQIVNPTTGKPAN